MILICNQGLVFLLINRRDHEKVEELFNKLAYGQPDPAPSYNITNTEPSSSIQDLKDSERKKGTAHIIAM